MLKKLLLGIVVLLLVLTGVSYLFPRYVAVSRSAQLSAPPEVLYPLVATPAEWPKWSPWNQRDTAMTITFSGPASGAGARWDWKSESQGDGGMVFTKADPIRSIDYELTIIGMGPPSYGSFVFTPNAEGTLVTWDMNLDMGNTPMGRWFGLYMPTMLGKDFEDGLRQLGVYAASR
jgi:uncharacterized protein YndB with AHSA1/START domain